MCSALETSIRLRPLHRHIRAERVSGRWRASAFTDDELERVLDVFRYGRPATGLEPAVKAQPELVPPVVFAAITGWRMKSEVLKLEWRQVDLDAGTVSLLINTTKSGEPRVFPFGVVPRLAALLREQREATTTLERATGTIIPLVFHRRGRQIRNMRMAWKAVCRRAGVPGRVPHDLRRTAARSLRALGMSDRDIAEMCGWETIEMVSRYLGRDPSGVADRLRLRLGESSDRLRTIRLRAGERVMRALVVTRCGVGAGGGTRTHTRGEPNGILSPARLPVSPLRHATRSRCGTALYALRPLSSREAGSARPPRGLSAKPLSRTARVGHSR